MFRYYGLEVLKWTFGFGMKFEFSGLSRCVWIRALRGRWGEVSGGVCYSPDFGCFLGFRILDVQGISGFANLLVFVGLKVRFCGWIESLR